MSELNRLSPVSVQELAALVGRTLGPSRWREVTQVDIDAFAAVTGDHQWIHTDPGRAAPVFGSTIAHGLYTLSLGPAIMFELIDFGGFSHSLNYGYNKIRFPAPLPVGSCVCASVVVISVQEIGPGNAQMVSQMSFVRENQTKPVCVAEMVGRFTE